MAACLHYCLSELSFQYSSFFQPSLSSTVVRFSISFPGFIVDQTRDYDAFFYTTGAPYLMAFITLFFLSCFKVKTASTIIEEEAVALHGAV